MTTDFQEQQRERLDLEGKIKELAERYVKTEHPILRHVIDTLVVKLIDNYETQKQARTYHLYRYSRIKEIYEKYRK